MLGGYPDNDRQVEMTLPLADTPCNLAAEGVMLIIVMEESNNG